MPSWVTTINGSRIRTFRKANDRPTGCFLK